MKTVQGPPAISQTQECHRNRALPTKSVTLSVTALVARMRALSLSSYFIFISKNPAGTRAPLRPVCQQSSRLMESDATCCLNSILHTSGSHYAAVADAGRVILLLNTTLLSLKSFHCWNHLESLWRTTPIASLCRRTHTHKIDE